MKSSQIASFDYGGKYVNAPPGSAPGTLGPGSRNILCLAARHRKPFRGLLANGAGSRVLFQVKTGYGGLSDIAGPVLGAGSLFSYIANSLFFIGAGQVTLNGANIGAVTASSSLKILLQRAGSYVAADSGPYTAGLNQPSSPTAQVSPAPGTGYFGLLTGTFSFKIAALRKATGARSLASPTSAIVFCQKGTVYLTLPTAQSGQSDWVIFSSQPGLGGIGPHYRMPYAGALQVSEATVAASSAGGIGRTIEIEFSTGDLVPETAYIYDFAPPAGTHCFALENVVGVGGCYSDATSAPSSTSPGTCIAISQRNFPESFRPTDLLYLPEQILSILHRPSDSFLYILCRNSVHAIQYTGASDGPACILSTVWPDCGVGNAHGACQVQGVLFAFVARGGAVTIGALGQPDNSFSADVREDMANWDPAATIVGWNPDTQQVVYSNGGTSLAYNLTTGEWSPPSMLSDFVQGSALSSVQSQNNLQITMNNGGVQSLYTWNGATGSQVISTAMANWTEGPAPGQVKKVFRVAERWQFDQTSFNCYVSIHRNMRKQYATDFSINAGSANLSSDEAGWSGSDSGKFVLVMGAGPGGLPLLARIKNPAGLTCQLVSPTGPFQTAAPVTATTTVITGFGLIAARIYTRTPTKKGYQRFRPKRALVRDAYDISVGQTMVSLGGNAQALGAALFGTVQGLNMGNAV